MAITGWSRPPGDGIAALGQYCPAAIWPLALGDGAAAEPFPLHFPALRPLAPHAAASLRPLALHGRIVQLLLDDSVAHVALALMALHVSPPVR
jgi:hypothetical protein